MSYVTRTLALFGLTVLIPLTTNSAAIASEYQPWLSVEEAKEFCNTQEIDDMTEVSAHDNEAQVTDVHMTPGGTSVQHIDASNTGWTMQHADSITSRDCSAIVEAEAHRYATHRQSEDVRYVNDSNLRQGILGNLLAW